MEGLHVRSEGRHLSIAVRAFLHGGDACEWLIVCKMCARCKDEPSRDALTRSHVLCTLCGERLRKRRLAREARVMTIHHVIWAREREPRLWGPAGTAHENWTGRAWIARLLQHSRLCQHTRAPLG